MDQQEAPTPHDHDAIPVRDPEEPYAGLPGHTRYECVHLVESDGSLRSIAVCRAINAQTHPELKERALSGQLHRLEDGRELALSFVYHDPDARKFALVIPTALAHLELKEWSKLMAEIAEDTLHSVPAYVREMTTVLGVTALASFIDSEPELVNGGASVSDRPTGETRDADLDSRVEQLAKRERDLADQERALARAAESLAMREDELTREREEVEAVLAELEARELELRASVVPPRRGDWKEVGLASLDTEETVVSDLPSRVAGETANDIGPPPLPAMRGRPASRPPPLPLRPRRTPPPLAYRHRDANYLRQHLPRPGRTWPPPLPSDAVVTDPTDPEPNLAPPPQFLTRSS
jgi:hypothetical protein